MEEGLLTLMLTLQFPRGREESGSQHFSAAKYLYGNMHMGHVGVRYIALCGGWVFGLSIKSILFLLL